MDLKLGRSRGAWELSGRRGIGRRVDSDDRLMLLVVFILLLLYFDLTLTLGVGGGLLRFVGDNFPSRRMIVNHEVRLCWLVCIVCIADISHCFPPRLIQAA